MMNGHGTSFTGLAPRCSVPRLFAGDGADVILVGTVAAALSGWRSTFCLLRYVRKRDWRTFVWCRWAFAPLVVAVLRL